jgi:hypothetical protein
VNDGADNCPLISNPAQNTISDPLCNVDTDQDNVGDGFDNCVEVANPSQADLDADGTGDACDNDQDNDSVANGNDNCGTVANQGQGDDDGDGTGDACDTYYCVVIDPNDPDGCLDPKAPFRVSAGSSVSLRRGQRFYPTIFANRNGAPIGYEWTVTGRPAGSKAAVVNPTGSTTTSIHWQYAHAEGTAPHFTPDVDGDYVLQLTATLGMPDRVHPGQPNTSVAGVGVKANQGSLFACGVAPAGPMALALAAALTAQLVRREGRTLNATLVGTARLLMLFGVLFAAGLALL